VLTAAEPAVLLLLAGILAGVVGTAGGITSLVSYPALLAVGVPAWSANVANLVAAVALWPGAAAVSQRELAGSRRWLARGLPVAAGGAAAGAGLLLTTPPGVFSRAVPFLVAAGSLVLLVQPLLTARTRGPHRGSTGPTLVAVAVLSVYSGYFGAGSGVLLLALLLVLVDHRLPQANAGKNMLLGACGCASAAVLVVMGPVEWEVVAPLAAGLFLGSLAGPVVARRLPAPVVRWSVGLSGLGLAVRLGLHPP
jgi:uncharacterized membrane protein YfcA